MNWNVYRIEAETEIERDVVVTPIGSGSLTNTESGEGREIIRKQINI